MEVLARLGVAITELLEAEGRSLRGHLVRLGMAAGIGLVLLVVVLAGLGFLLYGFFLFLNRWVAVDEAALLVGAATWIFAGLGLAFIRNMLEGPVVETSATPSEVSQRQVPGDFENANEPKSQS